MSPSQQCCDSVPSRFSVYASPRLSSFTAPQSTLQSIRSAANIIVILLVLAVALLTPSFSGRNVVNRRPLTVFIALAVLSIAISICFADYMELGTHSSCVVLTTSNGDSVKCFGRNDWGELGYEDTVRRGDNPNEMGEHLPVIDFGANFRFKFLSPSAGHFRCAISHENTTTCWGRNNYGQLGYGNMVDRGNTGNSMGDFLKLVDLGGGFIPTKIVCGRWHTCVLSVQHTIKCFGYNFYGQLGYNDVTNRGDGANEMGTNLATVNLVSSFVPVDIALGGYHSCVLSAAGAVKCWGWNGYKQLGDSTAGNRGDSSGEVTSSWTDVIDLGTGFVATQVCAGEWHTCVLSSNGTVKCFGSNTYGQLGIGSTVSTSLPTATVDLGQNFFAISIACGAEHNCALSSNHSLKCWGRAHRGQLGYEDTVTRGTTASTMGDALPVVDLGDDFVPEEVKCSYWHTCSTSQDGRMKCFGSGMEGRLGYGDTMQRGDGIGEMGNNLPVIDVRGPTSAPTASPSNSPSASTTMAPSSTPSSAPTIPPSAAPTLTPSSTPSSAPTTPPSASPTMIPSPTPSSAPTAPPSGAPTMPPGVSPTVQNTSNTTTNPTTCGCKCKTSGATTEPMLYASFLLPIVMITNIMFL